MIYELRPTDGRKSFYGKALVEIMQDGTQVLYSYGTKILTKTPAGDLIKHFEGWTATTGRHIKAFCGLNKQQFEQMEG